MLEWLHKLHSVEGISGIIQAGGMLALIAIVFAETGLLVGFFLPGDSLLVTAGVLANPHNLHHVQALNILWLNLFLSLAAVAGDQVNFIFGGKIGNRIWDRPDSRFYKRKHMEEAHAFYEKWGPLAIVGARFVPILRTFVPFVAGVARMPYHKFVFWNILGGIGWVTAVLWLGYFIGQSKFAQSLDKVILIVIAVSFLPIVFGLIKRRFFPNKKAAPVGNLAQTKH